MKKKASLLISGITTVAMLAVAVGSFAAWDKLTADTQPQFSATSGDAVVLTVASGDEIFSTKTLIPGSNAIQDTNDITELYGLFTPSFTDNKDKGASVYAILDSTGTDSGLAAALDVEVCEANPDGTRADSATAITPATINSEQGAYALTAGKTYGVYVKFKAETGSSVTDNSSMAKQNIVEKVVCKAYKTV